AEVGRAAVRSAGKEHVVGLLGAELVRTERAGGPADRVGDVRFARSVGPDDHADARLEAHLDEIREGFEATQLDGAQMHRSQAIESDGCRTRVGNPAQGLAGSLLLGGLLRAAVADAELFAVDDRSAREVALVRW